MCQPLAQATDLPGSRQHLRAALGVVGTPQLALRLGYATGVARTPRRDIAYVLDRPPSQPPATAAPLAGAALSDVRLGVGESEGGRLARQSPR